MGVSKLLLKMKWLDMLKQRTINTCKIIFAQLFSVFVKTHNSKDSQATGF